MSKLYDELEQKIKSAYESGTSLEEAEKLASEFLYAQIQISNDLQKADLNARMRKSGLKTIKAAIFLDEVQKAEKKPTDSMLTALIDSNDLVIGEQKSYDEAEVKLQNLERYYSVFREAHIHFRGISKGRFE